MDCAISSKIIQDSRARRCALRCSIRHEPWIGFATASYRLAYQSANVFGSPRCSSPGLSIRYCLSGAAELGGEVIELCQAILHRQHGLRIVDVNAWLEPQ